MSTQDPQASQPRGRFARWLKDRTGLPTAIGRCPLRDDAGRPGWWSLWISLILCGAMIQVITGWCLWMYYSPSAQTAWESVYFIQNEVAGGWLLRGLHYWTAQALVALLLLHVAQMIVRGVYRAPREFVYWSGLGLAALGLGLCLTGDLLSWDQNALAATQTRVGFLNLLPGIGGPLFRLAAGGPEFGNLALTRFFALHVACFAGSFFVLVAAHVWLAWRASPARRQRTARGDCPDFRGEPEGDRHVFRPETGQKTSQSPAAAGWWRWTADPVVHSVASLGFLIVVLVLVFANGPIAGREGSDPGDRFGKELGAPADRDPANYYTAARPEWTFRGLYGFSNAFPGELKVVAIFVVPGVFGLLLLLAPVIAGWRGGHGVNLAVLAVLAGGLIGFSYVSWVHDAGDADYLAARRTGEEDARRVKELIRQNGGIPPAGALSLLRNDPMTEGPRLWKQQCAACHAYTDPEGKVASPESPTAPDLAGFASREWIAGLLDPKQVAGPKYFGNTTLRKSPMVDFVRNEVREMDAEAKRDLAKFVDALAAEATRDAPTNAPAAGKEAVRLADDLGCTGCHRFYDKGLPGKAPELTGYGSRAWIVGVIADPIAVRFYGKLNDRMPSYRPSPQTPGNNLLDERDIQHIADWLRGE